MQSVDISELALLHREDLINVQHPSVFFRGETYDMLLLRIPEKGNGAQTHAFVLKGQDVYRYIRTEGVLWQMEGGMAGLWQLLDPLVDELMQELEQRQEHILTLEESVTISGITPAFMNRWLVTKKQLISHERLVRRGASELGRFISTYSKECSDDFPEHEFHDLAEHLHRCERSVEYGIRRLDDIYNLAAALSAVRTNRIMYALTLISVIFLPLNLVVGYFGMNTGGLPFAGVADGTAHVGMILTGIVAVILTIAVLLKWRRAFRWVVFQMKLRSRTGKEKA